MEKERNIFMSHYFSTVSKFIQNATEVDESMILWLDIKSIGVHICFRSGFTMEEEPPENKILIEDEDAQTRIEVDSDAKVIGNGMDHELLSFIVKDSKLGCIDMTISNPFTSGIEDIRSLIPKEMKEESKKNKTSA